MTMARRWWRHRRPRPAPRVSVVIATYNWSSVLRHAIASVLGQTLADFEVIVVGDCCTDDSAEVVASFGDPRLHWHNLEANFGNQAGPNNAGLARARGEYVAYLGQDDLWLPHHLATLVDALATSGADFAHAVTSLILPDGGRWLAGVLDGPFDTGDFSPPSGLMHRREAAAVVGPWPDYRQTTLSPDTEWQQRALACGLRFVSSPRLSVIKFPTLVRRNCYVERPDHEQAAWLERIRTEPDLEQRELVELVRQAARGSLTRLRVSDLVYYPPGFHVRRARVMRGLDPGAQVEMSPLPAELTAADLPLTLAAPAPAAVPAGSRFRLDVTLANRSASPLDSTPPHPFHLAYRWLDAAGTVLPGEPRRSVLTEPVLPGAVGQSVVEVVAPEVPGRYSLRLVAVQELVRWFEEPTSALPEVSVEVTAASEAPTAAGR
jgi:glycosyltransferase involved in cell wall biosynthesis